MKTTILNLLLIVCGSLLTAALAATTASAVFIGDTAIPYGNDSFYHAARALDVLATGEYIQFDARIHVPEGSWITWPWAYDLLLAAYARGALWLNPGSDPMIALVFVPLLLIPINLALLLGVFRQLGLRTEFCVLAVLGFALLPLTHNLHALGAIDHHFVELSFVLAVT